MTVLPVVWVLLVLAAFLSWYGWQLSRGDLDRADKLSSVVGAFAGVAGLGASVISLMVACAPPGRSATRSDAAPDSAPTADVAQNPDTPPIGQRDPVHLGVHRAITVAGGEDAPLTPNVERDHDRELQAALRATGRRFVVLVGGSSTGKTRAAYEAVCTALPDLPLIHPLDAAELVNLLHHDQVPGRSVLWLDELQVYLRGADGERAAALLRRRLTSPEPPTLVATLWPASWRDLTSRDASHGGVQTRLLLSLATRVDVPDSFPDDPDTTARLAAAAHTDRRLAAAHAAASDGRRVTQVLAGGPELVRRYEHPAERGERYAIAVLTTAMQLRTLGLTRPLPATLLQTAATGYLSPELRAAPPDWFAAAVHHAQAEVNGVAALTGVRSTAGTGAPDGYVLHDYLAEYAHRHLRSGPPADVWDALILHVTNPEDRRLVAAAARHRWLRRHAAELYRLLADAGSGHAAYTLYTLLSRARHDGEATQWRRRSADLGEPNALMDLARDAEEAADPLRVLERHRSHRCVLRRPGPPSAVASG
jgi:hypothetical protein